MAILEMLKSGLLNINLDSAEEEDESVVAADAPPTPSATAATATSRTILNQKHIIDSFIRV